MLNLSKPKLGNKSCKNVAVENEIFIKGHALKLTLHILSNLSQYCDKNLAHFILRDFL